jgi:hypothetical protein
VLSIICAQTPNAMQPTNQGVGSSNLSGRANNRITNQVLDDSSTSRPGSLELIQLRRDYLRGDDRKAGLVSDIKHISVPSHQEVGLGVSRQLQKW